MQTPPVSSFAERRATPNHPIVETAKRLNSEFHVFKAINTLEDIKSQRYINYATGGGIIVSAFTVAAGLSSPLVSLIRSCPEGTRKDPLTCITTGVAAAGALGGVPKLKVSRRMPPFSYQASAAENLRAGKTCVEE